MYSKKMLYQKMKSHYAQSGHCSPSKFGQRGRHRNFRHHGAYPPVNVKELDDRYEIFVSAAGFSKKDFQISLVDNMLTIKVESKEKQEATNWHRQEFTPSDFEQKFELNDKVDSTKIEAVYTDGILQLTLIKIEGTETVRTEININ